MGGISGLIRMQSQGGMGTMMGHHGAGHVNTSQSVSHLNSLPTGGGSGGMDVKAMIGEAKRRSDQRLNTDHQYLHRQAFACVRVGPTGFVWLSNNTGKVKKLKIKKHCYHITYFLFLDYYYCHPRYYYHSYYYYDNIAYYYNNHYYYVVQCTPPLHILF